MGAAEMKAGYTEEYVDGTSAAPWPQLDGVRPNTSPALVDDRRSEEDGEGRGGAKYNSSRRQFITVRDLAIAIWPDRHVSDPSRLYDTSSHAFEVKSLISIAVSDTDGEDQLKSVK